MQNVKSDKNTALVKESKRKKRSHEDEVSGLGQKIERYGVKYGILRTSVTLRYITSAKMD